MYELAKEASKLFFGQVWEDVIGYLKIYDYLKLKTKQIKGDAFTLPSVDSFWYSVLGDKYSGLPCKEYFPLQDGDVIKLEEVFLTEWG